MKKPNVTIVHEHRYKNHLDKLTQFKNVNFDLVQLDELSTQLTSSLVLFLISHNSLNKSICSVINSLLSVDRTVLIETSPIEDTILTECFDSVVSVDNIELLEPVLIEWSRSEFSSEDMLGYYLGTNVEVFTIYFKNTDSVINTLISSNKFNKYRDNSNWLSCNLLISTSQHMNSSEELIFWEEFNNNVKPLLNMNSIYSSLIAPNISEHPKVTFILSDSFVKEQKRTRLKSNESKESYFLRIKRVNEQRDAESIIHGKSWLEILQLMQNPRMVKRLTQSLNVAEKCHILNSLTTGLNT